MQYNLQNQRSARQKLLPFDGIQNAPDDFSHKRQARFTGFRQIVQQQREIQKQTNNKRLRLLSKVNDRSFEFPDQPKSKFQLFLDKIDSKFSVIRPQSTFMFCWNLFILIDVLTNFFEIPVALFMTERVYEDQFNNALPLAINIIFLIALIIDSFFIRFNLLQYKYGKQISSRIKIFYRYIKFKFWINLVTTSVLFFYIVVGDPNLIYLKILFYLKIISIIDIDQEIINFLCIHSTAKGLYKLFRIILLILFITTWVASIYFAIDYAYYKENGFYRKTGQLWLTNSNAIGNINLVTTFPWYIWYEYAVYWSLQTSSTVGYGDITPRNPVEVLYCNFIIVLNTVIFAFYINSIWEIIGQMQESENKYSENWANLKQIIQNQQLSAKTSRKISDYFHETWRDNQQQIDDQIDSILSAELVIQLNLAAKRKFFDQIPMFRDLYEFNPQCKQLMKKLIFKIKKQHVAQDEIIFQQGYNSQDLYYLLKGKVKFEAVGLQEIDVITINHNFGIQEFISQSNRILAAKAISFSKFFKLSLEDFKKILRQYPILYNHYILLKEKIIIYQEVQLANIKCIKCKSTTHFLTDCKQLKRWRRYLRQPIQALKMYNQGEPAQRVQYFRQPIKQKQRKQRISLKNKGINVDSVKKIQGYQSSYNIY